MVENGIRVIMYDKVGNNTIEYNVTSAILEKGFPKEFRESLKGEGYFEYRAKEFSYNLISPFFPDRSSSGYIPERYDRVKIFSEKDGECLFSGFVDEIQNEDDDEVLGITIMPSAVLLKDIEVGVASVDDDGETTRLFDTQNQKHIRDIVGELIEDVNASGLNKAGIVFSSSPETIPDMPDPPQTEPFNGGIVVKKRRGGYGWSASAYVFNQMMGESTNFDAKFEIRQKDGTFYLIKASASKGTRTLIHEAQWIDVSFGILIGVDFDWHTFGFMGINIPYGFTITPNIYEVNWHVPHIDINLNATIGVYHAYQLNGSSLDYIDRHDYAPLFPWSETSPYTNGTLDDNYGYVYTQNDSDNISDSKVRNFLKNKGYHEPSINIIQKVDINTSNTYVLATASPKTHFGVFNTAGHYLILLFETTFDEYYKCVYMNANASEIMKDLSIVGNRYFYVDPLDQVYMLPRRLSGADVIATNYAEIKNMLKKKKKVHRESDVDIEVARYEENDDGEISDYGIVLRNNEYEAIRKYYKDRFSHEREEYKMKFVAVDYDLKLLHNLVVRDGAIDVDYGVITSKGDSFLEPLIEVTTEKYNV